MCVNSMNMENNVDGVREILLRLGFEILSCHEEVITASKKFIYRSDIAEVSDLIDAWFMYDNKLTMQVKNRVEKELNETKEDLELRAGI